MSQPKGSTGVALATTAIIIIAVTFVGYYQFVYCSPESCSTSTQATSSSGGPTCSPPSCVTIVINSGAAALTTTAYTPDTARLVIGVNNTFQVLNNDSQSGGVVHSLTADSCKTAGQACPFDTGVIGYNVTKGPFTINTPGTYTYYCIVHPSTMIGTIVVVAGSSSPGGATSSSSSTSKTSSSSGSTSSRSTGAAKGVSVSIPKGADKPSNPPGYAPDIITVVLGVNNTVTWTNNDAAAHTVTSDTIPSGATSFNSGIMGPGTDYSTTFTVPGTYQYMCTLHSWMKGTVIVKSG